MDKILLKVGRGPKMNNPAVLDSTGKSPRSSTIHVLLADDHQALREGLARILETDAEIELVGQAESGSEAIRLASEKSPDIVIMDVKMPDIDGITATREIKRARPQTSILMFTMFSGEYVKTSLEAGASGYLLKDSSGREILDAVHQSFEGYYPLSPMLVREMMREYARYLTNRKNKILSDRQVQILNLLAEGCSSEDISKKIFVSKSTAKREIREIKAKLEVNDRAQAVTQAINRKLIELS
jgi:two-component system, NarL family, response regulator DegU